MFYQTHRLVNQGGTMDRRQFMKATGAASSSQISQKGVPAWEQDLEHSRERAGRRQDKEKMMAGLRKLGYM